MLNPFYATDLFLYPLKISGGIERDQWHEMDYADNYPPRNKMLQMFQKTLQILNYTPYLPVDLLIDLIWISAHINYIPWIILTTYMLQHLPSHNNLISNSFPLQFLQEYQKWLLIACINGAISLLCFCLILLLLEILNEPKKLRLRQW